MAVAPGISEDQAADVVLTADGEWALTSASLHDRGPRMRDEEATGFEVVAGAGERSAGGCNARASGRD